jgi:hypothetical protein
LEKTCVLLNVAPLSLGIKIAGGVMTALRKCNTTIPAKKARSYLTYLNNEPTVPIQVNVHALGTTTYLSNSCSSIPRHHSELLIISDLILGQKWACVSDQNSSRHLNRSYQGRRCSPSRLCNFNQVTFSCCNSCQPQYKRHYILL